MYLSRSLQTIAHMTRLRGADTVIVGLQPEVAFAMVQLGLTFDDMRVSKDRLLGEEGQGFTVAMNAMDFGRLTVAARSLGLAQACLDASVQYADQRMAFGKKIGHFQMIKKQIADMVCEVQAVRALRLRHQAAIGETRDTAGLIAGHAVGQRGIACRSRIGSSDRRAHHGASDRT